MNEGPGSLVGMPAMVFWEAVSTVGGRTMRMVPLGMEGNPVSKSGVSNWARRKLELGDLGGKKKAYRGTPTCI